jgi:hypothetical protein
MRWLSLRLSESEYNPRDPNHSVVQSIRHPRWPYCTSVTDPRAILGSPEVPLDLHVRIMLGRRRNVWANKHRASGYEGSLFGAAQFCTTSGVSGCGGSRPISTAILITQNGRATKAGINSIARTGNAVKIPSAPSAQQTASAIPP